MTLKRDLKKVQRLVGKKNLVSVRVEIQQHIGKKPEIVWDIYVSSYGFSVGCSNFKEALEDLTKRIAAIAKADGAAGLKT